MGNFTDFFTYGMGGFINSFNHSLSLSLAFWRERARARRSAAPNVDFHGNLTETHSESALPPPPPVPPPPPTASDAPTPHQRNLFQAATEEEVVVVEEEEEEKEEEEEEALYALNLKP